MSLAIGTRLGAFEITGQLGAGGMGEVYRAADRTLDREVAIKVLPASLSSDANRIARFEQEAKTLAALNHSNIASIYGLERSEGRTAIVMELVEGQTLAERIAEGPVPVDEAMGIALQIIAALEAAHSRQIVHRDLKPQNIMLKADGTVSVLDFGIAKAFESLPSAEGPDSPVLTTPVTQTGVILGTAAYMSPEQARGRFVDQRSDIWAFGCVLYEMLTGQTAFGGEDVPITLARVLAQDTDFDSLPAMISPAVRQTLRLCLEKDPRKRVADIRDVRLAFEGAFETIAPVSAAAAGRRWRAPAAVVVVVLLVFAAGIAGSWLRPEAPRPMVRSLIADPGAPFAPIDFDVNLAVSPNGERIAYRGNVAGEPSLLLRSLDDLEAVRLAEQADEIRTLFFSPDGNRVGFSDQDVMYRVSINGGPPVPIVERLDGPPRGATWAPDDTVIFATATPTSGLQRVPISGGTEPENLTSPDPAQGTDHWWPEILPGGEAVLFTIVTGQGGTSQGQIALLRLGQDNEPEVLVQVGTSPHYVESGHIVYAVDNTLRAVGFDLKTLTVTTNEFPVVDDVHITSTGASSFAVADNGSLVYASGDAVSGLNELVFVYRDGREDEVLPFTPDAYTWPRLSSDRQRVAVSLNNQEIWVYDVRRGARIPLTDSPGIDNVPLWTPDDLSVIYATQREGTGMFNFYRQRADGTGTAENILNAKDTGNFKPYAWTLDGTQLLFDYGPRPALNIGLATIGQVDDWEPLFELDTQESAPSLSRDGDWLAYASNRSGRCEIYMERFPELVDRIAISTGGGAAPLFSPTRDELYYRQGDQLIALAIDFENGIELGRPEVIAADLPAEDCGGRFYDISSDGEKFLFARPVGSAEESSRAMDVVLVQNWFPELERLVPND